MGEDVLTALETPARERVRRGAELLDSTGLPWANHVQRSDLDLGSHENCVLGQLWGSFGLGVFFLNMLYGGALDHAGTVAGGFKGMEAEVDELTGAWREEITSRRVHDVPQSSRDRGSPGSARSSPIEGR
jgi:hypothetical protein